MNLFSVNGGPLNGGSRLALVAAAAAIACSSLVVAVAVRAQEALSPVYSGAKIAAAPTLYQAANAGVGGTSFLAARPKHTAAASAKFDATVDLRGFVFRGVEAKAKFVSGADFLAIPASVLGVAKANPCSATVEAVATKRQPGKSGVSPAGVSIVADSVATRGAVATTVAGLGAFYAEAAINGVGEAYGRVAPSSEFVATGMVTRPASAAASAGADCQAVGAHVVHGRASVASGGYDVFAAPHVIARGLSGMAGAAELVAVPKRELRPRATASGTAGLVASTKTNHGSAAVAVRGAVVLTAKADRKTAAASNAGASAEFDSYALRTVQPVALVAIDSNVNTTAQRSVFASADRVSAACAFAAFPDTTVREVGALLTAGVALQSTPVVTRYVAAYSGCGADVDADPTRTVEPAASASTLADFSAQALLTATYSRADDLYSTADFAAQPDVTIRMADAAVQATAAVDAAPYVTRHVDSLVSTSAGFEGFASRTVQPQALAEVGADATTDAIRCLLPEANTGFGTADFAAQPDVTIRMADVAVQATADAWVEPQVTRHVDSLVSTSAGFEGFASRTVQPKAMVDASASTAAGAIRVLLGGADVGFGEADFSAQPDTTVRDSAADVVAGSDLAVVPKVTRPGHSICWADSSIEAKPTRLAYPESTANTEAFVVVDATRAVAGESWALVPWCWFEAVPDVTVRQASSQMEVLHVLDAVGTVVKEASAHAVTLTDIESVAVRVLVPAASITTRADFEVHPRRTAKAAAETSCAAFFSAAADVTIREAGAVADSVGLVQAHPVVCHAGGATVTAQVSVAANAARTVLPQANGGGVAGADVQAVRVLEAESWALVPWCWLDAKTDITVREGEAVADSRCLVSASGTVVKVAGTQVTTSSDFQTEAVRVLVPVAKVLTGAEFHGEALRTASAKASATAVAHCAAVADTTIRNAAADMPSAMHASAKAVTNRASYVSVAAGAEVGAQAVRVLLPGAAFKSSATASALSVRVVRASAHTSSTANLQATPDVTVRQATASSSSGVVATAKATVKHSAKVQSVSTATVVAAPVVKRMAQSALGAGAVFSGRAVRSVWATAKQDTERAFFAAAPDVTVRKGVAVASTSANLFVSALVDRPAMVALATTAGVQATPTIYHGGNADIYCAVSLEVMSFTNLFSFDPDNRTFYRQATTTNFVRSAPITEFRRPA